MDHQESCFVQAENPPAPTNPQVIHVKGFFKRLPWLVNGRPLHHEKATRRVPGGTG
jgi:hypothetical protein